jgi:hypothetical protein
MNTFQGGVSATTRTTRTRITFRRPFSLTGIDRVQPAGTYAIETDEESIQGLSFVAYRRVSTRIALAIDPHQPGISETAVVDPEELAAARVDDATFFSKSD